MPVTIIVSDRMAAELRQWVQDECQSWPAETAYQDDLRALAAQLGAEIARQQKPLGAEFEAVWDDNAGKLYEP